MAMKNMLEDELDNIAAVSATTTPTPTPTPAPAPAEVANSNVQSWDTDDQENVSGTILKGTGLNYIKVQDNQPARIAFVPGAKIVGAPVHYASGEKRYYLCESKPGKRAKCCDKLGDPKGRASALVFHYINADPQTGKLPAGVTPQVEVAIFTMSRSNWDDVKNGVEEGGHVVDVDFRISVSEKQLTRKVAVIARVARWREIDAEAMALATPFLADSTQLTRALGRKYETVSYDPNCRT
jgi:hypothetical protein